MQLQIIIFFLQKFVDKEALDEDGITPFIRYFDDKNISNYNEEFGKYIIILKIYKKIMEMSNFDGVLGENTKMRNANWPQIPDHPCRTLIIRDSESGKTNTLPTLTSRQPDINKIYLYAKDPYETSIVNQQTWQFRIKTL